MKLKKKKLSGRIYFTSNIGFQNMFDKGTEYTIGWRWKGLYNSKLIELHSAF